MGSTSFMLRYLGVYVHMVRNVHRNHKAYKGRGEGGKGGMQVGEEGDYIYVYISLHYHHQNDSCIKMGSDQSRFNVSLIVRDKVARQCPQSGSTRPGTA